MATWSAESGPDSVATGRNAGSHSMGRLHGILKRLKTQPKESFSNKRLLRTLRAGEA